MTTNLAGASPVDQPVRPLEPKRAAFVAWMRDFANVADWDAVLTFIRENDAFDMLEKRVSKTAVRGYIDLTKAVPPGITYGTKLSVSVRKPTVKAED